MLEIVHVNTPRTHINLRIALEFKWNKTLITKHVIPSVDAGATKPGNTYGDVHVLSLFSSQRLILFTQRFVLHASRYIWE